MVNMELVPIDTQLLDHLVVEFGDHGRRAVEFLLTAQTMVRLDSATDAPRLAETVAYCLREAMKTIPASLDMGGGGLWKSISRAITDAQWRYKNACGIPGEDEHGALNDLLAAIDDLEVFHSQAGIHERRLIAIMVARTGAVPVVSGTAPIREYQDLLEDLDKALHGKSTSERVQELWNRCVVSLRQLFLPPDLRHRELDLLAAIGPVSDKNVLQLLPLIAGPNHLRYFLGQISSTAWLEALLQTELLDPPVENTGWPVFAAVERLAKQHGPAVADWLLRMYQKHPRNSNQAFYLADAGLSVGPSAAEFVLSVLGDHREDLASIGVRAVAKLDANSDLVEEFADVLLNAGPWQRTSFVDPVIERVTEGVTEANAKRRLQLICWKLNSVGEDEQNRRWIKYERGGSIADFMEGSRDDRFAVLLHSLAKIIRRGSGWIPVNETLAIVDLLPDDIRSRARALVLACNPEHPVEVLVDEIASAISTRDPTGDDLPLLERVLVEVDSELHLLSLAQALGQAPSVAAVAQGLSSNELPQQLIRSFLWACLLPGETIGAWAPAMAVMSGAFGRPGRESLEQRRKAEFGYGQSPMSVEDLVSLSPVDASQQISMWRPDPTQRMVGARELARTLETVIKAMPADWLASPVAIATKLKQPTYIHHYLRGVSDAIKSGLFPPTEAILDVVALVRAQPWDADPIGRGDFDYDQDWGGAERAAVDVVKALADKDVGFSGRDEEVWAFLEAKARDRGESSGIVSGARDALDSAINRPCTEALEAIFSLMAHEFRSGGQMRAAALTLLEDALNLENLDGAEHRAIIATRLGFLRHVAPKWVGLQAEHLFGSDAPTGLAQLTVDLAIKWSRPNSWLLENYRPLVRDAVSRDVDNALDHVLVAMLWDVPGYSVHDNVSFLRQSDPHLSRAGEMLGRLLRHDDVTDAYVARGVEFWDAAILTNEPSALAGFGWLAEVAKLDDQAWA
jgi:hypothetical protein